MSNIENVVKVDIALSKALVSQKNFGRAMVLTTRATWPLGGAERFKLFTSLDDVLAAGFIVTDKEYLAAKAYFSPAISPVDLMIGRGDVEVKQVTVVDSTALANILYSVTVNGVVFTADYTGGAPANKTALFTSLMNSINASANVLIAGVVTASLTTVPAATAQRLVLSAVNFSVSFTVALGIDLALSVAGNTPANAAYLGVDTNLAAITTVAGGSDWYGLILTSRLKTDILAAASYVESATGRFIFIGCNDDAAVLTSSTTDVASLIKASGYTRSDFFYSATSEVQKYPEAVWLGLMLPKDPGSATYALKTLPGIAASSLSGNEISNLIAKRASYYVTVGGVNVTQGAMTGDGDFIDIQVGIDWLRATMEQEIYTLLATVDKVPFTDGGILQVGNVITSVLKEAIDQSVLASYTTSFPKASDFTPTEKATRTLNKLKFTGVLDGAVHKVNVQGNVTF